VIERMEPTSGLEPLTCRLRILCRVGIHANPFSFQWRSLMSEHAKLPH